MTRRGVVALPALVALATLAASARATTWHVRPDGGGDRPTIAAAMTSAAPGDTVLLDCGTYFECDIPVRSGVVLLSATGSPDCATIDAGGRGGVLRASGVTSATRLVGLTLTGGRATFGGALWSGSGAAPTVERCAFVANAAGEGGAVYAFHSSPSILDCSFAGNSADYFGGAIACYDNASPRVTGSTFTGNAAGISGGAVHVYFYGAPTFASCTFTGNAADSSGGALHGLGGAIFHLGRTILWGNCAPAGAEIALADGTSVAAFACCDVDTSDGALSGSGSFQWTGERLSADPLFCAAPDCADAPRTGGVVTLEVGSPCDSAGNPCGLRMGAAGVGCPAAEPGRTVARETDLRAEARPNPFSAATSLTLELVAPADVELRLYSADGRTVRRLAPRTLLGPGAHRFVWDGRDESGRPVAAGVYFARITAGGRQAIRRLIRVP